MNGWYAVAIVALTMVLAPTPSHAAPPSLEVSHWDSVSQSDGFEESFLVNAVQGDVVWADVVLRVDGSAINFTVQSVGDEIRAGDVFRFEMAAYDFQRQLTATVGGEELFATSFGSGAGTPV